MSRPGRITALALASTLACLAGGCANPDAQPPRPGDRQGASIENAGEPPAPGPPSAARQAPAEVQRSPQAALAAFATRYTNWDYRTLTATRRRLAAISLGAARQTERQAAAASASDTTIRRARIANKGQVIAISPDQQRPGLWSIVTREQTSGAGEYEGLAASYHVTLARLARIPGGYAVSEWLPQS